MRVELKSERKRETGIEANDNRIDLSLGFYVQQTLNLRYTSLFVREKKGGG